MHMGPGVARLSCNMLITSNNKQKDPERKDSLTERGVTNGCGANSSPATHQTVWQHGGTGQDSLIHLADWILSITKI